MSAPTRVPTAEQVEKAKREREFWMLKNQASTYRQEYEALNPGTAEETQLARRGTSTGQRLKENYLDALEVRQFKAVVEGENSKPKLGPVEIAASKARIIEALAKAGKTAAEIEEYLNRISPHLDLYAMATDPAAQSLLFARTMSGGGQQLGVKDIIEVVKMASELKGPQHPQTENSAAMVSALGGVFQAAFQAAQNRNPTTDPVKTFNDGMAVVMPMFQAMNENQRLAFTAQIESLKNELRNADPHEFFARMRDLAESLGWHPGGSEDPEVIKHRLNLTDAQSQRAFELERDRWRHEIESKQEAAKERRQTEMVRSITGTLQKAFESPVVRELGKSVGSKIGATNNPLAAAQSRAAQEQIQNPLETLYDFRCGKCHKARKFSTKELTLIAEKQNGAWVCPDCGAEYKLQKPDKGPAKDGSAPTF